MRFYTFVSTGKERDEETGYGYFGARYMDFDLLTSFISVDRYASKYPFISPYAYCAWNPIKMIDPFGDTVFVTGDDVSKQEALRQIQQKSSNMTFSVDNNNMLTYEGKAKTRMEKYMKKIIESKNVNVYLYVQSNSEYNGRTIDFGGFNGNMLNEDGSVVHASQVVNVKNSAKWDQECKNLGNAIWHEIAEAYEGGLISLDNQMNAQPALVGIENPIYSKAHYNAGEFFPGTIETKEIKFPQEILPAIESDRWIGTKYSTTHQKHKYVRQ